MEQPLCPPPDGEIIIEPRPPYPVVGHCARSVRVLTASDTVGKAAALLRLSPVAVLPVVHGQRIVGMVGQQELTIGNGVAATDPVETVMAPPPMPLAARMTAGEGLVAMGQHGLTVAPVVDSSGRLFGMVTRADLVALASGSIRPARCGGMATPLGVYLTTGMARAGAGDLGLVLAGAAMGAMAVLSLGLVLVAAWLVDERYDLGILGAFGLVSPADASVWKPVALATWLALYALLFRWSPLAGYHAAEHMTVNAIESAEELEPNSVAAQPRVHPRCGTNLVVVLVFLALLDLVVPLRGAWLGIAALVLVLSRTRLGAFAQAYVTTRRPRPEELANGLQAGRDLIAAHQKVIGKPTSLARRVWCMGLLQAIAGLLVTLLALKLALDALGLGSLWALVG